MVKIIDSLMGSGKTSWAVEHMNNEGGKFIYVAPFLSECRRIKNCCTKLNFAEPVDGFKMVNFKQLIREGRNISTTHALFSMIQLTIEDMQYLREYTLVLDETVEVITPVENINHFDYLNVQKYMRILDTGECFWTGDTAPKRYEDIKKMADCRTLRCYREAFFWVLPVEAFIVFSNIYIMTFQYNASHMCKYLEMHGIETEYYYIQDRKLMPGHQDLTQAKAQFSSLISVYDGKNNAVGDRNGSLSATWWKERATSEDISKVLAKARSFFRKPVNTKGEKALYATYLINGDHPKIQSYSESFLTFNTKATNRFSEADTLAYLVNVYENPIILGWFKEGGYPLDEKTYALNTMLQWIWRSAIRNDKPIRVYIPSRRMRGILLEWLNNAEQKAA